MRLALILCAAAALAGCSDMHRHNASAGGTYDASTPVSAAAGASATRGALAVEPNQSRFDKFTELDNDGNGRISRAEAAGSPELLTLFPQLDTNSDGEISGVEFQAVPLARPDGTPVR